jgi:predicted nucleotidyltransferase
VRRIGYFGSYARGDWGPGSDLDLIVIVDGAVEGFATRAARWDVTELPVPADVLVYTSEEWESLARRSRFYETVMREAVWVWTRNAIR